jgi:hypothetical protein
MMIKKLMIALLILSWVSVSKAEKTIVQFSDVTKDAFWFALTDKVNPENLQGSTAFMTVDWNLKKAKFFGELVPNEQQNGFASFRAVDNWDLSEVEKIKFETVGDNRSYRLLLKDETAVNSENAYSYQATFLAGEEVTTQILEIKNFVPVYRGEILADAPALDVSNIRQIGIQLNDGVKGPYSLEFGELIGE